MTAKRKARRVPKSSREWGEHFYANERPEALPREGPRLSEAERGAVVASVQEFQLGESSEGRHLHWLATEYARQAGDEDYLRDLLALEGFGTVKRRWADTVFRRLRNLAGLEVSVGVLLTAEIFAKVYYAGLKGATRSPALRVICGRILRDEEAHVRFQSERLAILRPRPPGGGKEAHGFPAPHAVLRRVPRRLEEPRQGYAADWTSRATGADAGRSSKPQPR
jgi:hypothetical protein